MNKPETAYRILDLQPGASLKQVTEARDDLLTLWDPERLSRHPRLRSRAPGKIREIQQAYEFLLEEFGRSGPPRGSTRGKPAREGDIGSGRASLFDEMFSRGGGKGSKIPGSRNGWVLVLLTVLLVLLALFFWPQTPEEAPATVPVQQPEPEEAEAEASLPPADSPKEDDLAEKGVSRAEERAEGTTPPVPAAKMNSSDRGSTGARSPGAPSGLPPRKKNAPVLLREEVQSKPAPEPSPEARAFEYLLQRSRPARQLFEGKYSDLSFSGWKVTRHHPPELWLNLQARQPDGAVIDFVWSVNTRDGIIHPVNPAASKLGAL